MASQRPVRRSSARPVQRRKPSRSVMGGAPARAALVAIGVMGLAALAVAILGPKRLREEVFEPLQKAVGPQAEKLWDQSGPVRSQLASILRRAGDQRERLAGDLQSWLGHFRAS